MGRKRTTGVSHNKNVKTYKTTDRNSGHLTDTMQSNIASFFIRSKDDDVVNS